mmetsp:Transcript_99390/g.279412  ORF Transcript_99390/g.279412 Transcript_99390/m.279412 type:complete len:248 (-) Transcript_99390:542-1285(-)
MRREVKAHLRIVVLEQAVLHSDIVDVWKWRLLQLDGVDDILHELLYLMQDLLLPHVALEEFTPLLQQIRLRRDAVHEHADNRFQELRAGLQRPRCGEDTRHRRVEGEHRRSLPARQDLTPGLIARETIRFVVRQYGLLVVVLWGVRNPLEGDGCCSGVLEADAPGAKSSYARLELQSVGRCLEVRPCEQSCAAVPDLACLGEWLLPFLLIVLARVAHFFVTLPDVVEGCRTSASSFGVSPHGRCHDL